MPQPVRGGLEHGDATGFYRQRSTLTHDAKQLGALSAANPPSRNGLKRRRPLGLTIPAGHPGCRQ
jgi:hypothetical protein